MGRTLVWRADGNRVGAGLRSRKNPAAHGIQAGRVWNQFSGFLTGIRELFKSELGLQ